MSEDKASVIQLLFLDVDGVLTDGSFRLDDQGRESKNFHVRDGLGLKLLLSCGIRVILVSGRRSKSLEVRARDLGIRDVYQGVADKRALCRHLVAELGLVRKQTCSMGDDLPDLGMFEESGLRIAVADAVKEIRESADFITRSRGGCGAVREACEWLLKCQGRWDAETARFRGK